MSKEKDKLLALKFSDINSIISFKKWLKNNLDHYDGRKIPSDNEILIFLDFIKRKIFDSDLKDKKEYLKKIKKMKLRIENKRSD
tara:strand:+ start:249 stop:500 length:252 start_codon:yes stop_codon:yes gene_type:complete